MNLIQAKSESEYNEWDEYISNNPKGNHLILAHWLDSFKSYGFEKEIFYYKENNKIVGGFGAVIAKFSSFKFYIIPYGPVVNEGNEHKINEIVDFAQDRAKSTGCCYFQVSIPKSDREELHSYAYKSNLTLDKNYQLGKLFKYVYAADGANFINLKEFSVDNSEELLMSFSVRTRRDIRIGIKNITTVKKAENNEQIKEAYSLCELNAQQNNYSVRQWKSIGKTLVDLVTADKGTFLMAYSGETLVGSMFFVKSGNHLTYMFGGTNKEFSNIYPGYALQWEAMKLSLSLGYKWYNISLGGSEGVTKFKSKFNAIPIYYHDAHYHIVLNKFKFKLFLFLEKKVKPYKSTIAKWLSLLK